ncbi:MAG: hypothetical protein CMJ80_02720 [Planctomycetaceae bacterium]|nr:hypothetical protein [Planctomycetaceae bacterium]
MIDSLLPKQSRDTALVEVPFLGRCRIRPGGKPMWLADQRPGSHTSVRWMNENPVPHGPFEVLPI